MDHVFQPDLRQEPLHIVVGIAATRAERRWLADQEVTWALLIDEGTLWRLFSTTKGNRRVR